MSTVIPYLYYDVFARMIPGGLTVAWILAVANLPENWKTLGTQAVGWVSVVIPFAIAGATYLIGVLYESISAYPIRGSSLIDWLSDRTFKSAWTDEIKDDTQSMNMSVHQLRTRLWQELVIKHKDDLAHSHRFQAEAKMCLHSIGPAIAIAFLLMKAETKVFEPMVLAVVLLDFLLLLAWSAYQREWRRWIQVLATLQTRGVDINPPEQQKAAGAGG